MPFAFAANLKSGPHLEKQTQKRKLVLDIGITVVQYPHFKREPL